MRYPARLLVTLPPPLALTPSLRRRASHEAPVCAEAAVHADACCIETRE